MGLKYGFASVEPRAARCPEANAEIPRISSIVMRLSLLCHVALLAFNRPDHPNHPGTGTLPAVPYFAI